MQTTNTEKEEFVKQEEKKTQSQLNLDQVLGSKQQN